MRNICSSDFSSTWLQRSSRKEVVVTCKNQYLELPTDRANLGTQDHWRRAQQVPRGKLWRGWVRLRGCRALTRTKAGRGGVRCLKAATTRCVQSVVCTDQLPATHCGRLQRAPPSGAPARRPPRRSFSLADGGAKPEGVMRVETHDESFTKLGGDRAGSV